MSISADPYESCIVSDQAMSSKAGASGYDFLGNIH